MSPGSYRVRSPTQFMGNGGNTCPYCVHFLLLVYAVQYIGTNCSTRFCSAGKLTNARCSFVVPRNHSQHGTWRDDTGTWWFPESPGYAADCFAVYRGYNTEDKIIKTWRVFFVLLFLGVEPALRPWPRAGDELMRGKRQQK